MPILEVTAMSLEMQTVCHNLSLGREGEIKACQYLLNGGYIIKCKNYRTRIGEIDIIASKDGTLVFIEVKTRSNNTYGLPCEAVNKQKQMKIRRIAELYLEVEDTFFTSIRFDVIEVYASQTKWHVNHLKDAF